MFLKLRPAIPISIHALREEGDFSTYNILTVREDFYPRPPRGGRPPAPGMSCTQRNFYPRPPRGGRLPSMITSERTNEFLSTPSARRATNVTKALLKAILISIHALREEGDFRPNRWYGVPA